MDKLLPKNNFVECCKKLSELGLEIGPSGNLSFKVDEDKILITPSGADFKDVASDHIALYSISDNDYSGPRPSSDLEAHLGIYRHRNDVQAIVHTHAHYVVLLAMLGIDIHVYNTMHADYFGRAIKCVPFANHRSDGYGHPGAFQTGRPFLLEKHGGIILFDHQDPKKIAADLQAFVEIAKLYYEFLLGSEVLAHHKDPIPEDDLELIHQYYSTQYGHKNDGKDAIV